jgi:hypothetical protein
VTTEIPEFTDLCVPVDVSCCQTAWDGYDDAVKDRAVALAQQTFVMLTGFRVGGCPATIRPCRKSCVPPTWREYPVDGFMGRTGGGPYPRGGQWFNAACGCGAADCSCSTTCELTLPGEASAIEEVRIDGQPLDPTLYRLDYGNVLVALGGTCWPLCQNMTAGPDDDGSFVVTYARGPALDGLDAFAVGLLACEFAKACQGQDCRLPAGVRQISRQGVTMDLPGGTEAFTEGLTGIREVDVRIMFWNPHALTVPSQVYSPDVKRGGRRTTWP